MSRRKEGEKKGKKERKKEQYLKLVDHLFNGNVLHFMIMPFFYGKENRKTN